MNEGHNLIVVTFEDDSEAYVALSRLRQANVAGRVAVIGAAVVERDFDGRISVSAALDTVSGTGAAAGGLLGLLVGVLGGPLGVLMGFGAGATAGSCVDAEREARERDVLEAIAASLPAGHTALIAEVKEYAIEVIDGETRALGGIVVRIPAAEVRAALEAAEKTAASGNHDELRAASEERTEQVEGARDEIEAESDERVDVCSQRTDA